MGPRVQIPQLLAIYYAPFTCYFARLKREVHLITSREGTEEE